MKLLKRWLPLLWICCARCGKNFFGPLMAKIHDPFGKPFFVCRRCKKSVYVCECGVVISGNVNDDEEPNYDN